MFPMRLFAVDLVRSATAVDLVLSVAKAQSNEAAASRPRQVQKAQRAAARKADRAQRNAVLSLLKKC